MSKADDIFWRQFGIILVVLTLFGFAMAFLARDIAGDAHQTAMNNPAAIAARIAPMSGARVGDPSQAVAAKPKAAVSAAPAMGAVATAGSVDGEQIYNTTCVACHAAGVAGAPKMGDDAAWAPRIALGEDAMVNSVVNGKGAMPPKAGIPSLTEEQIRAAVQYLTRTAGPSATASATSVVASATEAATDLVKDAAASASDSAQQVVDKATSMADKAVGQAAGAVTDAVAGVASAATAATTAVVSSVAAAASGTPAPAPVPAPALAASAGKPGNEIYNTSCVACHATGAANAPKLNDEAAWAPRVATGFAAMLNSVKNGKGAMPPRGGLATLSDADIENAIRYMLKEAGVEAGS